MRHLDEYQEPSSAEGSGNPEHVEAAAAGPQVSLHIATARYLASLVTVPGDLQQFRQPENSVDEITRMLDAWDGLFVAGDEKCGYVLISEGRKKDGSSRQESSAQKIGETYMALIPPMIRRLRASLPAYHPELIEAERRYAVLLVRQQDAEKVSNADAHLDIWAGRGRWSPVSHPVRSGLPDGALEPHMGGNQG